MKATLHKRFIRFLVPRILYFCITGIILLLTPSFALKGAFYAVVMYLFLAGVFGIIDRVRVKKNWFDYVCIALSALLILFGACSILFAQYLVHMAPLYLGALLLMEGARYFIIAVSTPEGLNKPLLVLLSIFVLVGGAAVIVFTLGFGVDGVSGLGRIAGIGSILAGIYALVACLNYQKMTALRTESEEMV